MLNDLLCERITRMEIQDKKTVWVAWTNTDLTEGRGHRIPLHVAESRETAIRLGRKGSVMGCDCEVTKATAVKVGYQWLAPSWIATESGEDKKARTMREAREAAVARAKEAGLSDDDIDALVR